MNDWTHATSSSRPKEIEKTLKGKLYIRKNISTVSDIYSNSPEENHTPTPGYEYDEILLTPEEYDKFLDLTANPFYTLDTNDLKSRILSIETFIATSTETE